MDLPKTKKCHKCKKSVIISDFIGDKKEYTTCNTCRINVNGAYKKQLCEVCGVRGIYNYPNIRFGSYCKEHKKVGMVSVINIKCNNDECTKQATFNFKEEQKPLYCSKHKLENMVNIKTKRCINKECNKQPNFNYSYDKIALYCSEHKLENMVNVKGLCCNYIGCMKYPNFNYKGEQRPLYCSEHKLKDMVDIKSLRCIFEDCLTIPIYNYKVEKQPLYCKIHKKENMVDVKHKMCIFKDCNIRASFNYRESKEELYCSEHYLKDMVPINRKKCFIINCETNPNFGYCGQTPTHCSKHKDNKMFKNPKRTCIGNDEEECKDTATYGITEPLHCEEHSIENEICLIASKCKGCYRTDELLNKESLCVTFCAPDKLYEQHKTREKIKEKTMLTYLDKYIQTVYPIKDDSVIDTLCNLYRPDRVYDCGTHCVIIECDEEQHKNRKFCESYRDIKHAELSRMHEIYNSLGLPCIFLRWNPDNFKINGILSKKFNMKERLKLLVKWIEHCFNMIPEKELSPVKYKYLFYDNFKETDTSFLEIDDIELKLN